MSTVTPGTAGPTTAGMVPRPVAAIAEVPAVTGVSPRRGPVSGGNWLVVTGQGFVGLSAVTFGASSTVDFTVESPARLKVRAPAHAAGAVDIEVTGPAGRSAASALDRYTFDR
jgi:threonine dehydrogenase-like Zn-dependent dehydrogenase